MAFADDETSGSSARPIELYKFTGTFNVYRLTSHDQNVTNSDGTYSSNYSVKRNKLKSGTQEDTKLAIDLELSHDHPMVAEYAFATSPPELEMELYRCHASDTDDTILLWKGKVLSWAIEGDVAKLKVPSLFAYVLERPLPPIKYQGPCNHVLGDARCGVNLDADGSTEATTVDTIADAGLTVTVAASTFADGELKGGTMSDGVETVTILNNVGAVMTLQTAITDLIVTDAVDITSPLHRQTTTVASVNGSTIVVDASSFADNVLVAGILETANEKRMIVSNTGTTIVVDSAFASISATDSVTMKIGCDHAFQGHCINRFFNGRFFGGFPLVPPLNPFASRIT